MSENHNESGRFAKGNKASKLRKACTSPELRVLQTATKDEVIKCAHSLIRPWSTLNAEVKSENGSRLAHLTAMATQRHNHKFICWLLEMAIGRPKQTVESEDTSMERIQKLIVDLTASNE